MLDILINEKKLSLLTLTGKCSNALKPSTAQKSGELLSDLPSELYSCLNSVCPQKKVHP